MKEEKKTNPVTAFFKTNSTFLKGFIEAVTKGDGAVKVSLLVMGAGYWKRKQRSQSKTKKKCR